MRADFAAHVASAGVVFATLLVARAARADEIVLSVQLERGATSCPDAGMVRQRLLSALSHASRTEAPESTRVNVSFRPHRRGYEATIVLAGAIVGTRVIKHEKTSCDAMIDAVGATLALMVDPLESTKAAEPIAPPPPPPPPEAKKPPEESEAEEKPVDAAPPSSSSRASSAVVALDIGAGITRGLLSNVAPVFGIGARWIRPAPWSFGIGIFHQLFQRSDAARPMLAGIDTRTGSVGIGVTGLSTEVCYSVLGHHGAMALDACASIRAALVAGTSSGYPRDGQELRPLVTLGAGPLWSQRLFGNVALWARGSFDVPVVRASYSLDGVGIVYNGSSTFFALSAGASLLLP